MPILTETKSWLHRLKVKAYRALPRGAQDLLWRRTPAERIREALARRRTAEVAKELGECLGNRGILFLPSQTWFSSHFQRPQQMARALAASGTPVVYCEPWTPNSLVTPKGREERRFTGIRTIGESLYLLRWPVAGLRQLLDSNDRAILLAIWPWQIEFLPASAANSLVYEVIDDHDLFPEADEIWQRRHEELVKIADVLVASADDLLAQLKPLRDDVLLLPNAVALADWQNVGSAELPADMRAARQSQRVIGYYGAIAEWFDWPLWIEAAKSRPHWSFVLIGPAYDKEWVADHAAQAQNIHYLGPKPYGELPGYVRNFDVATIPFLLNSITHACSPVKLFEYMAVGKPIVTTAMREVLKYKSIFVANSSDEFVECLDEAIARQNDPVYRALLREEAERNTWESRTKALVAAVEASRDLYGGKTRRAALREAPSRGK